MPIREPINYDLKPHIVDRGLTWINLDLENIGDLALRHLDIRLNTLDTYSVNVHENSKYLDILRPDEEKQIPFQLTVDARGRVYVTIDGWRDGESFHWESPSQPIKVSSAAAEIESFFALTAPYPLQGRPITCEATLRGRGISRNLVIEFWAETPTGENLSLDKQGTDLLAMGETDTYTVEFTPEEEGIYVLHAYLFDGGERIDHQTDAISVTR
jgi:hypothetical protein